MINGGWNIGKRIRKMEAKDTVMTGKQIDAEMDRIEKMDSSYTTAESELCKTQAEISFKAGIKEVVEWINHNFWTGLGAYNIPLKEWQAKLKEWG